MAKQARAISEITQEWRSAVGSQKGQYRLGYADAGALLSLISKLEAAETRRVAIALCRCYQESGSASESCRTYKDCIAGMTPSDAGAKP